jgi:hypothetical protein
MDRFVWRATAEINNSDEIPVFIDTLTCCFVLAGITTRSVSTPPHGADFLTSAK